MTLNPSGVFNNCIMVIENENGSNFWKLAGCLLMQHWMETLNMHVLFASRKPVNTFTGLWIKLRNWLHYPIRSCWVGKEGCEGEVLAAGVFPPLNFQMKPVYSQGKRCFIISYIEFALWKVMYNKNWTASCSFTACLHREFGRELELEHADFCHEFRFPAKGFKYLGAQV